MSKAGELSSRAIMVDDGRSEHARVTEAIKEYGRLVQEAAAKEVSRYDVTVEADQKVTFKGSTYAQYIERMPLP